MNAHRKPTEEELSYIRENYNAMSKSAIAMKLGCSVSFVVNNACRIGVGECSYEEIRDKKREYDSNRDWNKVRAKARESKRIKYRNDFGYRLRICERNRKRYHDANRT